VLFAVGLDDDRPVDADAAVARLETEGIAPGPGGMVLRVVGRQRPVLEPRVLEDGRGGSARRPKADQCQTHQVEDLRDRVDAALKSKVYVSL
jgi:hypothetical protein